ncbi:MAG: SUF system NifU family Fe-S cluster assembly protein [Thermoanaerobaculum sp.]|nr:SUF system NifU family Fe-S cluster assembly protein [Thermoanaerobaculum sp.]
MGSPPEVPLDELYREVVLDHYRHPRGREPLARVDVTAQGFNPLCGDQVEVALQVGEELIQQVQVLSRGCAICTASASMMAEALPGQTLAQAEQGAEAFRQVMHGKPFPQELPLGDLEALEGVKHFPVRVKCALLPWMTLKEAIAALRRGERRAKATTE